VTRSSLWRHRDFLKLWAGETVSQFGTAVTMLALPLVAINVLHATAGEVGALTAVEFSPFILVGLPAGVWVDRMRRRPVMVVGDIGRALALASIPIAYAFDALTIWQLYAVAFTTGVLTVFFDVAYQSYLPSLVDHEDLADGNGKLEISRSAAQIGGPGLGGLLVGALSGPGAIVTDAVSYLFSAAGVLWIGTAEPPVEAPEGERVRMRTQIGEGLRYVLGHRLLRPIAMCTANSNLFASMAQAVMVIFMVRRLHFSAGLIGFVFALGNVGFLVGAALCARISRRIGLGRTIVLSMALGSPFLFLYPLATLGAPAAMIVAGQWGIAMVVPLYNISQVSLRQAICPNRLQGRMNASMRFMVWGTMPIGAALGGLLGGSLGLRTTLFIAAAGQSVSFLPPLLSPVWRVRSIAEAEADELQLAEARDGVVTSGPPAATAPDAP
jgi:MFS family permease